MKYNKFFIIATAAVMIAQNILAQDDMYFTPRKKAQGATAVTSQVVDDDAPYRYRIPADAADGETVDYGNSDRDVDEYNRRGGYSQQQAQDDSVTISRQEYEDYVYSRQMERFDDYNGRITLIVNDPWYYDPWYSPYYGSYYWGTSWYYPWYSSYSWYDPWYSRPYWGWGYSWNYGRWHAHYAWHRPYYGYHRPYYGYTGYRRGGYVNGRPVVNRGSYRGVTSTRRGTINRNGVVERNNTVRRSNAFGGTTSSSSSSRGGYIGNSRGYSGGSYNGSTTRSSGNSFGGGSYSGGSTRSGGGGFSGGGSRGGGVSHGGGRR